ncbi:hypothetical protein D3C80_1004850 [compost metagenome]
MAIKVVLCKSGAGACKFEKLVGRRNGNLGREDFRLGRNNLCFGDRFGIRVLDGPINGVTGFFKQRLSRMKPQRQIADSLDRVGIFPGMIDAAIYPCTALGAHEGDGFIDRHLCNPGIDRDLDNLENRTIGGRFRIALVAGNQIGFRHLDVIEDDST